MVNQLPPPEPASLLWTSKQPVVQTIDYFTIYEELHRQIVAFEFEQGQHVAWKRKEVESTMELLRKVVSQRLPAVEVG